ncbi:unnamed protein product [Parnassius apollo]|uniref:(apollo) hypothetical protein n=1 Tax=Parnassius apollo TaxID=110799 RepID=A0A8S3WXU8_PARAO|nr:unnamed protein product [Parnassius apollo]
MPKRCALGCSNKTSYHQFPHPEKNPDRFKAWVHIAFGKDRNRNNRLNFLAVPSLHLPGKSDEVVTSEKVLLVPEPVNEESSLAALKPTLTGKSNDDGTSDKVLLTPEPVNKENSLATLKSTLTGKSDEVGTSEKVLLVPEPVNEESSLATLKLTTTDNSARINSEHNYCRLQKKAIHKNNSKFF